MSERTLRVTLSRVAEDQSSSTVESDDARSRGVARAGAAPPSIYARRAKSDLKLKFFDYETESALNLNADVLALRLGTRDYTANDAEHAGQAGEIAAAPPAVSAEESRLSLRAPARLFYPFTLYFDDALNESFYVTREPLRSAPRVPLTLPRSGEARLYLTRVRFRIAPPVEFDLSGFFLEYGGNPFFHQDPRSYYRTTPINEPGTVVTVGARRTVTVPLAWAARAAGEIIPNGYDDAGVEPPEPDRQAQVDAAVYAYLVARAGGFVPGAPVTGVPPGYANAKQRSEADETGFSTGTEINLHAAGITDRLYDGGDAIVPATTDESAESHIIPADESKPIARLSIGEDESFYVWRV